MGAEQESRFGVLCSEFMAEVHAAMATTSEENVDVTINPRATAMAKVLTSRERDFEDGGTLENVTNWLIQLGAVAWLAHQEGFGVVVLDKNTGQGVELTIDIGKPPDEDL